MAKRKRTRARPAEPDRSGTFEPMPASEPASDEYLQRLREAEAALPRALQQHLDEWPDSMPEVAPDPTDNTP